MQDMWCWDQPVSEPASTSASYLAHYTIKQMNSSKLRRPSPSLSAASIIFWASSSDISSPVSFFMTWLYSLAEIKPSPSLSKTLNSSLYYIASSSSTPHYSASTKELSVLSEIAWANAIRANVTNFITFLFLL